MTTNTLILNKNYMPLGTLAWERAIVLVFSGKAEVLEEYSIPIKTINIEIQRPSVIRLTTWVKGKNNASIRFNKTNVYLRDKGKCQYCSKTVSLKEATLDHVVPKAHGGKTDWLNIVIACYACNQKKKDLSLHQAKMWLLTTPSRPTNICIDTLFKLKNNKPGSWENWIK